MNGIQEREGRRNEKTGGLFKYTFFFFFSPDSWGLGSIVESTIPYPGTPSPLLPVPSRISSRQGRYCMKMRRPRRGKACLTQRLIQALGGYGLKGKNWNPPLPEKGGDLLRGEEGTRCGAPARDSDGEWPVSRDRFLDEVQLDRRRLDHQSRVRPRR